MNLFSGPLKMPPSLPFPFHLCHVLGYLTITRHDLHLLLNQTYHHSVGSQAKHPPIPRYMTVIRHDLYSLQLSPNRHLSGRSQAKHPLVLLRIRLLLSSPRQVRRARRRWTKFALCGGDSLRRPLKLNRILHLLTSRDGLRSTAFLLLPPRRH